MGNPDDLALGRAQKVLIELDKSVDVKAVRGLRQKTLRFHFRINGLAEYFVKSQTEQERTQIVDVGDRPETVYVAGRVQSRILSAFFERRRPNAPVNHSELAQVHVGGFARHGPDRSPLRPAARGE